MPLDSMACPMISGREPSRSCQNQVEKWGLGVGIEVVIRSREVAEGVEVLGSGDGHQTHSGALIARCGGERRCLTTDLVWVWVFHRGGTQQQRVHEAENGGVEADSDGQ